MAFETVSRIFTSLWPGAAAPSPPMLSADADLSLLPNFIPPTSVLELRPARHSSRARARVHPYTRPSAPRAQRATTPEARTRSGDALPTLRQHPTSADPQVAASSIPVVTTSRTHPTALQLSVDSSPVVRVRFDMPGDTPELDNDGSSIRSRSESPLTPLPEDEDNKIIAKPKGEVSRPSRGGYNLCDALNWPQQDYLKLRVRSFLLDSDIFLMPLQDDLHMIIATYLDHAKSLSMQPAEVCEAIRDMVSLAAISMSFTVTKYSCQIFEKYPHLAKYVGGWPIIDIMHARLKYTAGRIAGGHSSKQAPGYKRGRTRAQVLQAISDVSDMLKRKLSVVDCVQRRVVQAGPGEMMLRLCHCTVLMYFISNTSLRRALHDLQTSQNEKLSALATRAGETHEGMSSAQRVLLWERPGPAAQQTGPKTWVYAEATARIAHDARTLNGRLSWTLLKLVWRMRPTGNERESCADAGSTGACSSNATSRVLADGFDLPDLAH